EGAALAGGDVEDPDGADSHEPGDDGRDVVDVDVVALLLALAEDADAAILRERAREGVGPVDAVGVARAVDAGYPERQQRYAGGARGVLHHALARVLGQRVVAARAHRGRLGDRIHVEAVHRVRA